MVETYLLSIVITLFGIWKQIAKQIERGARCNEATAVQEK
jgi:hypothetical protein